MWKCTLSRSAESTRCTAPTAPVRASLTLERPNSFFARHLSERPSSVMTAARMSAQRASDPRWMEQMGAELCPRLRSTEFPDIRALLEDEESQFDMDLASASTGGVPLHLTTTFIDPERLPHRHIPENRVLPALLHGDTWTLLPSKLYLDG